MKTFFICSDIHGFYDQWIISLSEVGFNKDNKDHILIVLGDIFDRGKQPWEVYTFLTSLSPDRVILIRGNHEYLLTQLVRRGFPYDNDISNGTYGTLVSLYKDPNIEQRKWMEENRSLYSPEDSLLLYHDSQKVYYDVSKKLYNNPKINKILKWIKSSSWRNYYELGPYIFVHSFIPLMNGYYYSDWRNEVSSLMWEEASWGCPYEQYRRGLFVKEERKGKILVCGHWHTSDFYNHLLYFDQPDKQLDVHESNPIFKSDEFPGIIGIDACTALTNKVNVLVIKEDKILKYQ